MHDRQPFGRSLRWAALLVPLFGFSAPAPADSPSAGADWPQFFGNSQAWSYSPLDQINREDVKGLVPVWSFSTGEHGLSTTPLVVDGVMYLLAPRDHLFALDAATGRLIWSYAHEIPQGQVGPTAAGISAAFGMIFMGTMDNHLVAIDAKTGHEVWDVQIEDYRQCKCSPSFGTILAKDKIVVGVRGDVAHRGYIDAYDAKTGKRDWRFWTVAGPGDPGHDTWPGDTWKFGGGATWYNGSYDPDLNLVFWGVGNPQPMMFAGNRPGDNLYTDSVVAIDADTGKLKWYFQEMPHDSLDFDSAPEPVLIDAPEGGTTKKLVVHASKSGFTFVLDRATGKLITTFPHADHINWTKGLDEDGRAIDPIQNEPGAEKLVCPSVYGSRAANHSTYSPKTGWWYNTSFEVCAKMRAVPLMPSKEGDYVIGGFSLPEHSATTKPFIAAFDPLTGKREWTHETKVMNVSPLLSTGGDLVFGGDPFGDVWALDAKNGRGLWSYSTGGGISSAPITYSVKGRQYVAIGSGMSSPPGSLVPQLWPEYKNQIPPVGSVLFVFALPENSKTVTP
jgi:alcohol dehydrogenase (cytochrome c)